MNNNNININAMNPEDPENLSLSLRPPYPPSQQLPTPPSPTPLAQPDPVYSPPMDPENLSLSLRPPYSPPLQLPTPPSPTPLAQPDPVYYSPPMDPENLSLSLRPPYPPPQQLPTPPSPTPLAQPDPVYSPPMEFLYSNGPLHFTPELDLVLTSAQTTYPTMDLNVAVNNKPPSPPPSPQNNGEAPPNRNIEPPYAWASDHPTSIHDKAHLEEHFIDTVTGTVRCNKCGKEYPVVFNIEEKLTQFISFVESKNGTMHDRAPPEWRSPPSLVCEHCTGDGVRPVIDVNKDNINWLFLFLGQMLGYCTLEQLKYFCGSNHIHRTAAKDRVLHHTYRKIFEQLLPHLRHQDPW